MHMHLFYLMLSQVQLIQIPVEDRSTCWSLNLFATIPAPQCKCNKTNQWTCNIHIIICGHPLFPHLLYIFIYEKNKHWILTATACKIEADPGELSSRGNASNLHRMEFHQVTLPKMFVGSNDIKDIANNCLLPSGVSAELFLTAYSQ